MVMSVHTFFNLFHLDNNSKGTYKFHFGSYQYRFNKLYFTGTSNEILSTEKTST